MSKTGPLDAEELRERLGLQPRSARDFFDALVALGMLARDDARYSNTAATELFLDPAKPSHAQRYAAGGFGGGRCLRRHGHG
jgi:hypothetical protein